MKYDPLIIKILDKKIKKISEFAKTDYPFNGWIKLVRNALGMNVTQFAKKIGVTQPRVVEMEKDEMNLKLSTIKKIADSLDCNFVYAIIPKASFQEMQTKQARKKAAQLYKKINHNMSLEDQSTYDEDMLEIFFQGLLNGKISKIWDDEDE